MEERTGSPPRGPQEKGRFQGDDPHRPAPPEGFPPGPPEGYRPPEYQQPGRPLTAGQPPGNAPQQGYPPQGQYQDPHGYYPETGQPPPGYYPPTGQPPPRGGLSRTGWIVLGIVVALLMIGSIFGAGFLINRYFFTEENSEEFDITQTTEYKDTLFDIRNYYYHEFDEEKITSAATEAVQEEKEKGVESEDELLDAGLTAMVEALDDQHSEYLTPAVNKRLTEDLSGSFYGVGFTLRINEDEDRPQVVSVIENSPAERSGIKPDDIIAAVDGKDTKGLSLDNVVLRIRGKKGTKVELEVDREDEEEPLTFEITREKIDIPDFESEIVDGKYGVLKVYDFNRGVSEKVREAVQEMQGQGVQGFLLDLRNNPGGLLDEAVKMGSVFVDEGVIVSYQVKGEARVDESAEGNAATDLPLVVLINEGSASSSEIVAGALQDQGRATLVGGKSYGKGSVQKVYDLDNEGAVKLTIALYYLPNGESIDGQGIQPDIEVLDEDDPEREMEIQFEKAKEVLENLIQGNPATGLGFRLAA